MNNKQQQRELRRMEKMALRDRLKSSNEYKVMEWLTKWFDKRMIDPLLGWIFPEVGDLVTAVLGLPSLYLCLFKIRSIPLTLAVLFNIMIDMLIGLFPVLGDIGDFFFQANTRNFILISGWLDDDPQVVKRVKHNAVYFGIGVVVLAALIVLAFFAVAWLLKELWTLLG